MIINHNINALNTHRQMATAVASQGKSMEKLSSGLRINRAADDAAGLSISEKMRSQVRGLDQASRNAQDGISFIQTAEGALNEVSAMAGRLKELAVQVSTGTYSTDDTKNIGLEMKELGTAMNEILTETKFNGIDVFGDGATITYGEDASLSIDIAAATVTDFTSLKTLTDAADTAATAVTVTAVEDAITEINLNRATYGSQQNKLEHVIQNQNASAENIQAAESRIRDVDMAKEMMNQTKNSILAQAAQAMLAQSNQAPQGVLQLLR